MGGDLHNVDLILFALVAVFLVLRLRSVLGQRNENDPPPGGWRRGPQSAPDSAAEKVADNVIDLNAARTTRPPADLSPAEADLWAIDPAFDLNGFLSGARSAFHMIVEAYAAGNRQTLRPLLTDEVFQPFSAAIGQRELAGESLTAEIIAFRAVELVAARQDGPMLLLSVRFVTDQINMRKDREGRVLDGDPVRSNRIADEWTFSRDRRSTDPNWLLVSTRAPSDVPS